MSSQAEENYIQSAAEQYAAFSDIRYIIEYQLRSFTEDKWEQEDDITLVTLKRLAQ